MKTIVTIFFFLVSFSAFSQIDTSCIQENIEKEIIETLENIDFEEENDFAENLSDFFSSSDKININDLTADVAFSILKMSDYQYYQLQKYISENGFLVTVFELAAIEGFSVEFVQRIEFLIETTAVKNPNHSLKNNLKRIRHKLLFRYSQILESKAGYNKERTTHYLGTPQLFAFRYNFQAGEHITLGFSGKKNAGEQFFKGTQKQGFGFYSFHIQVKKIKFLQSLILGDYRLHFGQGLIMGSGFLSGVNGEIRKTGSTLRPVTAMSYGNFLRGSAIQLGNYKFSGTIFYGHRFIDGNLVEVEPDIFFFDGSISNSGYYRTETEIKKRNALLNRVYGAHFKMQLKSVKVGVQLLRSEFSKPVLPRTIAYQFFDFSGKGVCNFSTDYQWNIKHHIFFGEVGVSSNGGWAILQGAIFKIDSRVKFSVLFRHFSKKFIALDGAPYIKNSKLNNETGILLTSSIILTPKINLLLILDLYQWQWLHYLIDKPTQLADAAIRVDLPVSKNCAFWLRYSYKTKYKNFREETYYNQISNTNQHRTSLVFAYNFPPFITCKSEVSVIYNTNITTKKNKFGFLIYQDIGANWQQTGLNFKTRFALFDTDSYDERLYAYENDLTYTFNINSYYYRGFKTYLIVKWKYKWFEIQGKISRTIYFDRNQISSGLELIEGNAKTEVKLQTIFNL